MKTKQRKSPVSKTPVALWLDSLVLAPYNPPGRVEKRRLKDLAASMSRLGLIYPIIVTPDHEVADGHRRIAAARLLGWKRIEAIVVNKDRDQLYAEVNATAARMSSHDRLHTYIDNPDSLTAPVRKRLEDIEEKVGRGLLLKMKEAHYSEHAFHMALRLWRYCGSTESPSLAAFLEWAIRFSMVRACITVIQYDTPVGTILKAVRSGKALQLRFGDQK